MSVFEQLFGEFRSIEAHRDRLGRELEELRHQYNKVCAANENLRHSIMQQFLQDQLKAPRPRIVCLCGSTRFGDEFAKQNLLETLEGRIVLSIGCNLKGDDDLFREMSLGQLKETKERLDELHKRKIDLADEILVLNVGGYVGDSTRSEIHYARSLGKPIRWLMPPTTELEEGL